MELENVQIEIKNKEHYEAVKKRLQELGKWYWGAPSMVDEAVEASMYHIYINLYSSNKSGWGSHEDGDLKTITLDDLYEVKKEKVAKERFRVYKYDPSHPIFVCGTHQEAVDFIKKQDSGTYEIKKFYEVVEE